MTVFAKKGDHFKRLKKKKTKPHFFPHQCSNSTDVIFLFDFSKFIFVVLIIIFCRQSIFVTVGIQRKRKEKQLQAIGHYTSARAVILKS